jgi:hypothetical protein
MQRHRAATSQHEKTQETPQPADNKAVQGFINL